MLTKQATKEVSYLGFGIGKVEDRIIIEKEIVEETQEETEQKVIDPLDSIFEFDKNIKDILLMTIDEDEKINIYSK